jgi:ABC-2 type transport system permease protein
MFSRILALLIRYKTISFGSIPRLISIFYWPSVQILFWGFFTNFLVTNNSYQEWGIINILLSAVVLWDVLFRGQLGLTMSFLEEIWSRNLTNLFISPIREYELVIGLIFISFLRTIIGLTPAIFMANYFFDFHLFELGFFLIFFFLNLIIVGWSIGFLVSSLVLRFGHSFEELAWAIIFILLPFSCVYYPLDSLPSLMQNISLIFPPSYIFEAMRKILINGIVDFELLKSIVLLNIFYLLCSIFCFLKMISISRKKGLLINQGE